MFLAAAPVPYPVASEPCAGHALLASGTRTRMSGADEQLLQRLLLSSSSERERILVDVQSTDPDLVSRVKRQLDELTLATDSWPGTILRVASPYQEGEECDGYRLGEVVGSGGMGVVYRAEQISLGRVVALKIIREHLRDEELLATAAREARITDSLKHDQIPVVFDVGRTSHGRVFYTMTFVEGQALEYALPSPGDEEGVYRALQLIVRICDVVRHAHDSGVVHRDLKPKNILVSAGNCPDVVDWGAALELDAAVDDSRGQIGTLGYLSPEQARGDPVDLRTDVYSMGAILYRLLSGHRPFGDLGAAAPDSFETLHGRSPTPIERIRPRTAPELVGIVRSAMAHDRSRRCSSVSELKLRLEQFLARSPSPYSTSLLRRVAHRVRRHPRISGMAVVAIATAFAVSSALWFSSLETRRLFDEQRTHAEAAWEAGRLRQYGSFTQAIAELVGPDALENVPSWRTAGSFPITTVLRYLDDNQDHEALVLAAAHVATDGYERHPVLVNFLLLETERTGIDLAPGRLLTRLLNENAVNSPGEVLATEEIRAFLLSKLRSTDARPSEVHHALSALSAVAHVRDLPTILETYLRTEDPFIRQTARRVMERTARRSFDCGTDAEMPWTWEDVIRIYELSRNHSHPVEIVDWCQWFEAFAFLLKREGLATGWLEPPERLLATEPQHGMFQRVRLSAENDIGSLTDAQLSCHYRGGVEYFHEAFQGRLEAADQLDPASLLKNTFLPAPPPRRLTIRCEALLPDDVLASWTFSRDPNHRADSGLHRGCADGATSYASTFEALNHVRLNRFGKSRVTLPFDVEQSLLGEAVRVDIEHVLAKRVYMPYSGVARVRAELDGHDVGTLAPASQQRHVGTLFLPATLLATGRHELTLTLTFESSTTYWLYGVHLTNVPWLHKRLETSR